MGLQFWYPQPPRSRHDQRRDPQKQKQYLFPSVSTYYSDPLVTDHASMQHLWDVEGNKYLDFFGGIVTISVGHANPRVTSKIKAQMDKLQHASMVFPNEAVVALAEKIAQITLGEISQSFLPTAARKPMSSRCNWRACLPVALRLWRCAMATADALNWRSR